MINDVCNTNIGILTQEHGNSRSFLFVSCFLFLQPCLFLQNVAMMNLLLRNYVIMMFQTFLMRCWLNLYQDRHPWMSLESLSVIDVLLYLLIHNLLCVLTFNLLQLHLLRHPLNILFQFLKMQLNQTLCSPIFVVPWFLCLLTSWGLWWCCLWSICWWISRFWTLF
jgi:hypothetical protein